MNSPELLALVEAGPLAWNDWRVANPTQLVDFQGADFNGRTLNGFNFSGVRFEEANFKKAQLIDIQFQDANLSGINLSDAMLKNCWLNNANISYARLVGASVLNCDASKIEGKSTDFREADLSHSNFESAFLWEAHLGHANLTRANFTKAVLQGANLNQCYGNAPTFLGAEMAEASLSKAHLEGADFREAILDETCFSYSRLPFANFCQSSLFRADFFQATLNHSQFEYTYATMANFNFSDLSAASMVGANLQKSSFVGTCVQNTKFQQAYIYGINVWDLKGQPANQSNLQIAYQSKYLLFDRKPEVIASYPAGISVDDLAVAQFVYLLMNRANLRKVLDTISSKAVLILGRFTPERKAVLETLADELRSHQLLPIIFDFEQPDNRTITETIKTLAGISLFVIADITNPRSAPLELQATVPDYAIPFVILVEQSEPAFSMFKDLWIRYDWVLSPLTYGNTLEIKESFKAAILDRAWQKHQELQLRKSAQMQTMSMVEFTRGNE